MACPICHRRTEMVLISKRLTLSDQKFSGSEPLTSQNLTYKKNENSKKK